MVERKDLDHRPINGPAGHERRAKDGNDQQRTAETASGYCSTTRESPCRKPALFEKRREYSVGFAVENSHNRRACQPHQRLRPYPPFYPGGKRRVQRPAAVSHLENPNHRKSASTRPLQCTIRRQPRLLATVPGTIWNRQHERERTTTTRVMYTTCYVHYKHLSILMKPQHRVSWRHPSSIPWHQLDLIVMRGCN